MNKTILSLALSASTMLASAGAMAADGSITFTGKVLTASCQIEGGDSTAGGAISVAMPQVGMNNFVSGAPIAPKDFKLKLKGATGNCLSTGEVYSLDIEDGDVSTYGNVKNAAVTTPAEGVEVQLSMAGVPLDLKKEDAIKFPATTTGEEEIDLTASLIAQDASKVKQGEINAVANFMVIQN
ncbi:hypothetical protein DBR33_00830 [Stenotrophomonas sp. HMWF022]|uniref:fimbrial protein n=1 Tax=Stenotrophomonas sp. HMWF023 TaxID=2056859 RepID=UPI000D35832A|nr:fimbrial protein [Stenotrophomonas sp. HMWF023]PTS79812.1 hypothetical protein DBR20_02925 [Stenotrophomonas sp. HMWF023]PTT58365.1 hypothetical protein DBR33_00830 [Stenotrophomonas sp. HMWF022]